VSGTQFLPLRASPVTLEFSGTITEAINGGIFPNGTLISGQFTYESSAAPSSQNSTAAEYLFAAGSGLTGSFTIGSSTYSFDSGS
jgi:hypothetical protein